MKERSADVGLLMRHYLNVAAKELNVEVKVLRSETEQYLTRYEWPGNVRQLGNVCRWLTVMAPGPEIHVEDLPPELRASPPGAQGAEDWESALRCWADLRLGRGESALMDIATPQFERTMIDVALTHTGGRRQEAARLLGLGRNTLTRKIKELGMESQVAVESENEEPV